MQLTRSIPLMILVSAPALAAQETAEAFVQRHAGADERLSAEETRAALAELELMVVVRRELREADARLEVLRHQVEERFEDNPGDGDLRESVLLGLVAHVELQLARGYDKDAWNEFPELPAVSGPSNDPETEAWRAIMADPRVAKLHEYVGARIEGRAASPPEGLPLVGLRPDTDEVEQAVREALPLYNYGFIQSLGERAAPALAKIVLEDLDRLDRPFSDPLYLLVGAHAPTALAVMREHLGRGGFFWKKRVLRALSHKSMKAPAIWDTRHMPWVCSLPDYLRVLEGLVEDPDVGTEALPLLGNSVTGGALTPKLQGALIRALSSTDLARREAALSLLPSQTYLSYQSLYEAAAQSPFPEVRIVAAKRLVQFQWNDVLAGLAQDPDWDIRRVVTIMLQDRTLSYLREDGQKSKSTVNVQLDGTGRALLLTLLQDPNSEVRWGAVRAMRSLPSRELGPDRSEWIDPPPHEVLVKLARDSRREVRQGLASPLFMLPMEQSHALGRLMAGDSDVEIADQALRSSTLKTVLESPLGALSVVRARAANPAGGFTPAAGAFSALWKGLRSTPESAEALVDWAVTQGSETLVAVLSTNSFGRLDRGFATKLSPETLATLLSALDDGQHEYWIRILLFGPPEQPISVPLSLAQNSKRSAQLRAYAAVTVARRLDQGWQTSLLEALTDPWWLDHARSSSDDYDTLMYSFERLVSARRTPVALAAVHRDDIPALLSASLAARCDLSDSASGELRRAILARWFEPENPEPDGSQAVLALVRSIPKVAELQDLDFLDAALTKPQLNYLVARQLGKLRDPAHLPLLAKVIREQRGTDMWNVTVTEVLPGYLTDEGAELLLQAAAWAEDPAVRASCLASLASMREYFLARDYWAQRQASGHSREQALAELLVMLDDPTEAVRVQAVRALGTLDAVTSIPRLIRLLKDPSRAVSSAAEKTLEYLNRPREQGPGDGKKQE
jgi:HEAT repeats